jgi:hypothetical protein
MGALALIPQKHDKHGRSMIRTGRNRYVWILLLLGILLLLIFVNPEKIHFISCPFKQITGISCLTCGLSRSFHAASHFQLKEAFRFHLMGPILLGVLFLFFVKFSIEEVTRREIRIPAKPVIMKIVLVLLCGMWIGFWIMRLINELSHP